MRHNNTAPPSEKRNLDKAARCGEPSYVWRAGQERRLQMILNAAGGFVQGRLLENGCGIGMYALRLAPYAYQLTGLEYDFDRAMEAQHALQAIPNAEVTCAAGEKLPFPDNSMAFILSHEVIEHVQDDRLAVSEMMRVLRPGGRLALFAPNRGYPFETHGVYWRGNYRFGNIPLVNYLPRRWRNKLAPHVRVYSQADLKELFKELPVRVIEQQVIFGAYDNIIARRPRIGKSLRLALQWLEKTPLQHLGLSHFWVIEKISPAGL